MLLTLLVYLIVFVILFSLGYYVITALLPEPIRKIALIVLYVIAALVLVVFLLNLVGTGIGGPLRLPR